MTNLSVTSIIKGFQLQSTQIEGQKYKKRKVDSEMLKEKIFQTKSLLYPESPCSTNCSEDKTENELKQKCSEGENQLQVDNQLENENSDEKGESQRKKQFQCDRCQKQFIASYKLQRHMLIHTGQRPYSCKICLKSFNQFGNLKTHARIHDRQNLPFSCDKCEKKFNQKAQLEQHLITHQKSQQPQIIKCNNNITYDTIKH